RAPRRRSVSPERTSTPASWIPSSGTTARPTRTAPLPPEVASRSQFSTMTTAFAPRGTGAPVATSTACPFPPAAPRPPAPAPGAGAAAAAAPRRERGGGEREADALLLVGAEGVARDDREAVDDGAVEGRQVDARRDVRSEHAAERLAERHLLDAQRLGVDGAAP